MDTVQPHVYRVWYVNSVPNCLFFFMSYINTHSIYIVCHVESYSMSKVHLVQIKFWLIMANSASDHSSRLLPFVLVMTYSLTT